jgi:hypothetical protein
MAPPLIDIIHRSFVLGLVGIGGYGLFMGWKVHEDTLRRGKGAARLIFRCLGVPIYLFTEVRH